MSDNKKVLIITYYWPPSGGAGVQRWLKFAKYLPQFGIEPVILTVDPKKASYLQIDDSLVKDINPGLKVYRTRSFEPLNILSRLLGKGSVPYAGFTNVNKKSIVQTILRFVRGNFFIPDARVGWNRFAYKKAKELVELYQINTVITTSPPNSTQQIGLKLKKHLDIKWIADFRDPWTDIYYYNDLLHTPLVKRIDRKMEREVISAADVVITNCESNRKLLESKIPVVKAGKFQVVTNGFDEEEFNVQNRDTQDFIITYSGTISDAYRPEIFFYALSKVRGLFPEVVFKLKIVGNVSPEIENLVHRYDLAGAYQAVGYVKHEQLVNYLMDSTVLFYIFPKTENDKGIAGKLFEYLAARKTILAIGPKDGDSAKILHECGAGRMFEREEGEQLINYWASLVNQWKQTKNLNINSGQYLKYSRKILTSVLKDYL